MRWKPLLFSFTIILLLWASFLSPWTMPLWNLIDTATFKILNSMLDGSRLLQYFWALINHKRMDLVEDLIFLLFFIWGIYVAPKALCWKRTFQFFFSILLTAAVIFFINRGLFETTFFIPRESPSLVVTPCVRITQEVSWKGIKDETIASFPGDHATTLLLFGLLYSAFVPRRLSTTAWVYITLRTLPRLVVGAHWLSDIAVGSLSIALFFSACFLYTPVEVWLTDLFERSRLKIKKFTALFSKMK